MSIMFPFKGCIKKKENIWLNVKAEKEIGNLAETIWGKKPIQGTWVLDIWLLFLPGLDMLSSALGPVASILVRSGERPGYSDLKLGAGGVASWALVLFHGAFWFPMSIMIAGPENDSALGRLLPRRVGVRLV